MNTDKILTTLTAPPCNWEIIDAPANVTPNGSKIGQSPEAAATISLRGDGSGVTMRCAFAHDTPAQTATRNLNYLMVCATALGDTKAPKRILSMIKDANRQREDTQYEWTTVGLHFALDVSFTERMTTLEVSEVGE